MTERRWLATVLGACAVVFAILTWRVLNGGYGGTAISRKDRADILTIEHACETYAARNGGTWPRALDDLVRPDATGTSMLKVDRIPLDPWGRAYHYEPADVEFPFARIWTYGRDGLPGGEDADQDVGNWMFRW